MAWTEDEWHGKFRDMAEVPFSDALRQRILSQAQQDAREKTESADPADAAARYRRRSRGARWQPWTAAVSGFCILVCMAWGVWSWKEAAPLTKVSPIALSTAGRQMTTPIRRNIPFGLLNAPVSMPNVQIGTEPGYAGGSFVIANMTNLGTTTLHEGQVFGVLWFNPSAGERTLRNANWATFVNFELADGQKQLAPGDSGVWSFRPVGAPTTPTGKLVEVPHLAFYKSGLVSPSQADVTWPQARLDVRDVRVAQRKHWVGGQSIQVTATLHNPTRTSIALDKLWAVVWFSKAPSNDWTRPDVVRFLDVPAPVTSGMTKISHGQTSDVYFRLIGSDKTDFLGMIPHVTFIQR